MKKFPWILAIVGGAAALYFLSRGSVAKNFKTVLRRVKFGGKILQPKIFLTFGIQNPTGGSANIRSLVGDVIVNGNKVADVSSFTQIKIEPNAETLYQVQVEPSAIGIGSQIRTWLKEGVKNVNVDFNGFLNVDGNTFPIKTSYSL